eukprot:Protomagalhaensia_wolfi_Nauph_80__759@NODE_1436_length_1531_cov_9_444370_g1110_i0_p2_GENE_NODE_1436_length_1531_cov_9_444370_g1110_i0NODE_1436_length_1531_cov_9_444370_g1110_i0_p2_ORF_typecomplete_len129_score18_78_NODE_1436_length_1531_cov_9_444370_g1110_i09271313
MFLRVLCLAVLASAHHQHLKGKKYKEVEPVAVPIQVIEQPPVLIEDYMPGYPIIPPFNYFAGPYLPTPAYYPPFAIEPLPYSPAYAPIATPYYEKPIHEKYQKAYKGKRYVEPAPVQVEPPVFGTDTI